MSLKVSLKPKAPADPNRPVARDEMTKLQWTWKEMKRNKTAYFMLAPFLILFIIFTVLPVVLSIFLSLTDFNMLEMPGWVGIDNYTRLFLEDEIFMLACQNTLIFAAVTGPVSYLLSLLVAWFVTTLSKKFLTPRALPKVGSSWFCSKYASADSSASTDNINFVFSQDSLKMSSISLAE